MIDKKICFVVSSLLSNSGGLEKSAIAVINYISLFFKVYVYTKSNRSCSSVSLRVAGLSQSVQILTYCEISELDRFRIIQKVRSIGIDLFVLMFSWAEAFFWYKILTFMNVPYIYSEHSAPELIISRWNESERNIVLNSAEEARVQLPEYIPDEYKDKVHVIPNIIEPQEKKVDILSNSNVLYVGRLNRFPKQTHLILDVFQSNSIEHRDCNLHVYGTKNDKSLNLSVYNNGHILFHGFESDRNKIFNNVAITCVPSAYEGISNVVLESLSFGVPVIGLGSCVGVCCSIGDDFNGILTTPDELSKKINHYLSDYKYRESLQKNTKKSISEYSSDLILPKWYSLIVGVMTKIE